MSTSRIFPGHTPAAVLYRMTLDSFFLCVCLTFVAMGFFKGVYLPLAGAAILGVAFLAAAWWRIGRPAVPPAALLPFVFAVYVAIVPAWPTFADMQIADISLELYIAGLGTAFFFPRRTFLPTLCLSACICCVFIYWLIASPPEFTFGDRRLRLLFNHPNVLGLMASWCIVHILCVWGQLPRWSRPLVVALILCMLTAILLTDGRSTYLSIMLAILGSGFFLSRKLFLKVLLIGMLCCVGGYGVLTLQNSDSRLTLNVKKIMQEQSMQSRIVFWKVALEGFYSAPLTGLGHRTYGKYLDSYIDTKMDGKGERPRYPHNMYMDVLYSWGGIGAGLLIAAFGFAVAEARRKRDYFLPLSLLLMLGHGLFDSSLHMKAGLMVLFIPQGLLWGDSLRSVFTASPLMCCASAANKEGKRHDR